MEVWQVVAVIIAAGCYAGVAVPAVRRLADRLAQIRALADAEREHRRATCPNLPPPGAMVVARGGWCAWCRITHDQRNNFRRPTLDTGTLRCSNISAWANGGTCPSCGVPHRPASGIPLGPRPRVTR